MKISNSVKNYWIFLHSKEFPPCRSKQVNNDPLCNSVLAEYNLCKNSSLLSQSWFPIKDKAMLPSGSDFRTLLVLMVCLPTVSREWMVGSGLRKYMDSSCICMQTYKYVSHVDSIPFWCILTIWKPWKVSSFLKQLTLNLYLF